MRERLQAAFRLPVTVKLIIGFLLTLILVGWLTGCATTPTAQLTRTVTVSVPCVRATDIPPRPPMLAETAWAQPSGIDVFERAKALKVDRLRLLAHADKLEAILKACAE